MTWRHIPWTSSLSAARAAFGHHYINRDNPDQQLDFRMFPEGSSDNLTPRAEVSVLTGTRHDNQWATVATVPLDPGPAKPPAAIAIDQALAAIAAAQALAPMYGAEWYALGKARRDLSDAVARAADYAREQKS